jgi:hypothetical protein
LDEGSPPVTRLMPVISDKARTVVSANVNFFIQYFFSSPPIPSRIREILKKG